MALKVKVGHLAMWRAERHVDYGWCVVEDGPQGQPQIRVAELDEETARVIAAAPRLLRFMQLFQLRANAPAGIDVSRVLSLCGLELEA